MSTDGLLSGISQWLDQTTGIEGSLGVSHTRRKKRRKERIQIPILWRKQEIQDISKDHGSLGLMFKLLFVLQYIVILLLVLLGHKIMNGSEPDANPPPEEEEEEEPDPPRNFTTNQLKYFNGENDERTGEAKAVYLSLNGIVFDVSDGRNFYGPDGPYAAFAGRECGVALAKMSFDTEHLDNLKGVKDLNYGENDELENWINKFTYHRHYPVKGRLVADEYLESLEGRTLTSEDLSKHKGDAEEIPEGYATAPIYIGAGNKVFDASFGGVEFYGE